MNSDEKRPTRMLRFWELKSLKGIDYSRASLLRLEKPGKFPRRIQLGENKVAWDEGEIDEYLALKKAARVKQPSEALASE